MRTLPLIAAVCMLGPGCKKDPEPEARAPESVPVALEGYPAPGELPVVTLLSPGGDERRRLRYDVEAGTIDRFRMTLEMKMRSAMGGGEAPKITLPPLLLEGTVEITRVEGDDIHQRFEYGSMTVGEGGDPMIAGRIRETLNDLGTFEGTAVHTRRGLVKSAALDLAAIQAPAVRQMLQSLEGSMRQLSTPLPEEPVGVGAAWRARHAIDANGLRVFQQTTFTLKSLSEHGFVVEAKLVQQAPEQTFAAPGMPPGVTARLRRMMTTGGGTLTVDERHVIPGSDFEMDTEMDMTVAHDTEEQRFSMSMDLDLEVARQ